MIPDGYLGIPDDLVQRYMEPHRYYHTLEHIYNGLRILPFLAAAERVKDEDYIALVRAWWAHDAIYLIGEPNSEALSSQLAYAYWGSEREITSFILETIYPNTTHPDRMRPEARCIVDADLSGLAAPPVVFNHHSEQIWLEQKPRLMTLHGNEEDARKHFDKGRSEFWTRLLDEQKPLFKTEIARLWWTQRAEANIRTEILK